MIVVFDQPIFQRPLSAANWSGRTGGPFFTAFTGFGTPTINYRTVTVPADLGAPLGGTGRVSYAAAPPDVSNRFLQNAPAFLNFPIT